MTIQELGALDAQYYMHTFGHRADVNFVRGSGTKLYDSDGREYTDFFTGIAVTSLGHGYPAFLEAVKAQLDKVTHLSNYFYNEPQAMLAQRLVEASVADRVFFANSGGEANEGAAKLARKYFKMRNKNRFEVLSLDNSFHGRTLAMVAATGQPKYQKPYVPLPEGFRNVQAGDLDALEAAITPRTAAILLETIQGEGGVIELPQAYLQGVEELCRLNGILLIVDEVQTGMGRTGAWFAHSESGVTPDVVTLAKGLAGGIPIGACIAVGEYGQLLQPGNHGTTFGGNPVASAAALAVIDTIEKEGLLENVRKVGAQLAEGLKEPRVTAIRQAGLLIGLDLAEPVAAKATAAALRHGFIINDCAPDRVRLAPPLVLTEEQASSFVEAWPAILDEAFGEES